MILKVDINYKINGLGRYEETILSSLEENDCFLLGNDGKDKVLIKKVFPDRVLFEFDRHSKLNLPSGSKEIEVRIGETFSPYLLIDPASSFQIKLVDIREEQRLYYS